MKIILGKIQSFGEKLDNFTKDKYLIRILYLLFKSIFDFILLGFGYHAAAISFYTLMSFLPLLVVLTILASLFVNLQEEFVRKILSEFFPTKAQDFFEYVVNLTSGSLVFGISNFILSFYFAGNIFTTLHDALNNVFEVRASSIKRVTLIRVFGIPMLIFVLVFIYMVNIFITLILDIIESSNTWNYMIYFLSNHKLEFILFFINTIHLVVHPTAYFILVLTIYKFLTPYHDYFKRDLFAVSLLISILLFLLKIGFDKYIIMASRTNPIYGSLSGIFAFLAWLYLSYGIILIGGRTLYYIRKEYKFCRLELTDGK